jgi:hypothetical protein
MSGHLPSLFSRHIKEQHEEQEGKKNIDAGDDSSFETRTRNVNSACCRFATWMI